MMQLCPGESPLYRLRLYVMGALHFGQVTVALLSVTSGVDVVGSMS